MVKSNCNQMFKSRNHLLFLKFRFLPLFIYLLGDDFKVSFEMILNFLEFTVLTNLSNGSHGVP
jgi:hypothetical protein